MADRNASAVAGFLVEDFITSITTQLDRVQDALRLKAVNRPLTYALKELHLELKVFVDMDAQGHVMLRAAGPNEAGASTLAMDFTTITKPMIEENTVSLATSRSASLDELGLSEAERTRLEQLGVRNVAQLNRLGNSAGLKTVERLSAVPVDRLRGALQLSRPRVTNVQPTPVQPKPAPPKTAPGPRPTPPIVRTPPGRGILADKVIQPASPKVGVLAPHLRRVSLMGAGLMNDEQAPTVRLNGETLNITELDHDRMVVELPEHATSGSLEVSMPDGEVTSFELPISDAVGESDSWAPEGEWQQ